MTTPGTATSKTEFLVSRGAVFDDTAQAVAHFGDPAIEQAAFTEGTALLDRRQATHLLHTGSDAMDLLHRLSTNDLIDLQTGESRFTLLTSERGRIIDLLQVAMIEPDRLLLISDSNDPQAAIDWIEKFTIIEDSEVRDLSNDRLRFALIGPQALQVVRSAFDADVHMGHVAAVTVAGHETALIASRWADVDRVDVVTPAGSFEAIWDLLVDAGATPAGDIAFESVRLERHVPVPGRELTEDSNPLEVGLKDLVSFTKGCYVGQEVVARLDTYDKLQKRLVSLESDSALQAGDRLTADGKRAGVVTSVSPIATSGKTRALGFARRDFWGDGTQLQADAGTVEVSQLPEGSPFS